MADGTFAALTFLLGLLDMGFNSCGSQTGCLGQTDVQSRVSISAGQWLERRAKPQSEVYVRYDFGRKYGPFGLTSGVSVAEKGELWLGIGPTYNVMHEQSGLYVELHAMPGVYFANGGFDLGHTVEFRSGVEIGLQNTAGWRYSLSYDHRSNTGAFAKHNPGVETVQLRVSVPLR